jgi:hypothetical protein
MSHNGREVMAEIAARHGWTIREDLPSTPSGTQIVSYERGSSQILVAWTPYNTAVHIAKHGGSLDQVEAKGPTGLLVARGWLEEPA